MKKIIKDNKVAVLISPHFGGGWYTWNTEHKELLFHPKLVKMVEDKKSSEITEDWVEKELGIKNVFCGGAKNLTIEWIDKNTAFYIDDYDGYESIHFDILTV